MVKAGALDPAAITADLIGQNLDAPDLPDPDLIIRTSGEQRLSNFLLWQAAYSELVFVPTYWPDFDRAALEGAIAEYRRRERRFGGLDRADRLLSRGRRPTGQREAIRAAAAGRPQQSRCCASCRRWCWRRSRSRRPISAGLSSSCSGPSPRSPCCGNGRRWSARTSAIPCWRPARSRWPARGLLLAFDRPGVAIALDRARRASASRRWRRTFAGCGARPVLSMRRRS